MKKLKTFILTIALFLIFPIAINAENPQSFKETVKEEIKLYENVAGAEDFVEELKNVDLSNYKTSDKKVNIYIFRGKTCGYCLKAIAYFASILDEYKDKINLTSYEVWYDDENSKLMNTVATLLDDDASGVPYIIIGKTSFVGYAEQYNDDIIDAIEHEYKKQEKYDIMEHLDEVKVEKDFLKKEANTDFKQTLITVLEVICGALLLLAILILIFNRPKKEKEEVVILEKEEVKDIEKVIDEDKKSEIKVEAAQKIEKPKTKKQTTKSKTQKKPTSKTKTQTKPTSTKKQASKPKNAQVKKASSKSSPKTSKSTTKKSTNTSTKKQTNKPKTKKQTTKSN